MSPSLSPLGDFQTLLQKQTKTRNDKPKQAENQLGMDEIIFLLAISMPPASLTCDLFHFFVFYLSVVGGNEDLSPLGN